MTRFYDFCDRFKDYSADELTYKKLYEAKKTENGLKSFFAELPDNKKGRVNDWLLAEKGVILSEITETLDDVDFSSDIAVTRHARYTPAFVHKHTFFEITYVLRGSCINRINNTDAADNVSIEMHSGDMCFIPPGVYHAIDEAKDSLIFNCLIKHYSVMDVLMDFLVQKNILASFFIQSLYTKNFNHFLSFHTADDTSLQNIIEALIMEGYSDKSSVKDEHHNALTESYLNIIFNLLVRDHIGSADYDGITVTDSHLILEIQRYISSTLQTATLKSLADHFNYSPSYLSRLIQQSTGSNFSKILRKIRIQKACSLLSNSDMSISSICEQTGYNCQRQFNRAFQDVVHMTPSEYRKQQCLLPIC